jgi:hypothetical protein
MKTFPVDTETLQLAQQSMLPLVAAVTLMTTTPADYECAQNPGLCNGVPEALPNIRTLL